MLNTSMTLDTCFAQSTSINKDMSSSSRFKSFNIYPRLHLFERASFFPSNPNNPLGKQFLSSTHHLRLNTFLFVTLAEVPQTTSNFNTLVASHWTPIGKWTAWVPSKTEDAYLRIRLTPLCSSPSVLMDMQKIDLIKPNGLHLPVWTMFWCQLNR